MQAGDNPGRVELNGDYIFGVNRASRTVSAFDRTGKSLGVLRLGPKTGRAAGPPLNARGPSLALNEFWLALSDGDQVHLWDLEKRQLARTISFEKTVRIVEILPQGLLLAYPTKDSLFAVSDFDGEISSRWGDPLLSPNDEDNSWGNQFFAVDAGDGIAVFFVSYPIVRLYDPQGELRSEGEYELPALVADYFRRNTPPLDVLQRTLRKPETRYPLLLSLKRAENGYFVLFNSFRAGFLNDRFELEWHRKLSSPGRAGPPWVLDLDATTGGVLVLERPSRVKAEYRNSLPNLEVSTKGGQPHRPVGPVPSGGLTLNFSFSSVLPSEVPASFDGSVAPAVKKKPRCRAC